MVITIMQPYFFPYIGYFQLMAAVDCFVFYDNAQYMKGGWINRNRILRNDSPAWLTFPIVHDDYRLPINQRCYFRNSGQIRSLLSKIEGAYAEAPYFRYVFPLLTELLNSNNENVASFNVCVLERLARHLGIKCNFLLASSFQDSAALQAQSRVIEICRHLGADIFINPIGGLELYENTHFTDAGIELSFLRTRPSTYPQSGSTHLPFLSIVDVMMFNSESQIFALLQEYDLLGPTR